MKKYDVVSLGEFLQYRIFTQSLFPLHADTSCCSLSIFLKKLIADNPTMQTMMPVGIKTKYTAL